MIRRLLFLSAAAAAAAFIAPAPLRVARPASAPPRRPPSPLGAADDEAAAADAAAADAAAAPEVAADDGGTDDADAAAAAADILNSPAFLKRKVEVLRADVASLEEEIAAVNATYLAGKEEWGGKFDMLDKEAAAMRDRAAKQGSQVQLDATIEVATRILDVLDNYDRAFQAVEAATDEEEEILATYRKTQDMVVEAFAELNVTRIATVGEEFDYELHQALMQIPSEEHEEGIVCQEMALGWKCGDRLIRPAMVAVAL